MEQGGQKKVAAAPSSWLADDSSHEDSSTAGRMVCMCVRLSVRAYVHACVRAWVHAWVRACACMLACACVRVRACAYAHACVYACMYVRMCQWRVGPRANALPHELIHRGIRPHARCMQAPHLSLPLSHTLSPSPLPHLHPHPHAELPPNPPAVAPPEAPPPAPAPSGGPAHHCAGARALWRHLGVRRRARGCDAPGPFRRQRWVARGTCPAPCVLQHKSS